MNSRQRIQAALNHQQPDRVPLDLGGSATSGMHASSVYKLRQALHLDPPGTPVKVVEPYQILGEIKSDLMGPWELMSSRSLDRGRCSGLATRAGNPGRFSMAPQY